MEWTDSQLKAIETRGRRVIVSAGAGSGKTRVLVERFLRLLEENPAWRVSDIAAVTFTEKAAREMVSRIRREIRSRIERSSSPEKQRRWREHRNALDSARIGTIHSLCSSILRAHPAEAGLDPAFEVVAEVEASSLLDRAIDDTLDKCAHATADGPPSPINLIEIFSYLTTREVKSVLRSLIMEGERARRAISQLTSLGADEIIEFWRVKLESARLEAATALIERETWKRDAQTISRLAADDAADKREQCRARVAELLARLEAGQAEAETLIHALIEIGSCIDLRGGSKKKWPSEEAFNAVRDALSGLREMVRRERLLTLEMNEADRAAAEVTARVARLYERVRERFAELKRERGGLDFNDLEEITERLLVSHRDVRDRYTDAERGLLRALMVDEFQDTSPIQDRIIQMIAPRTGELFIIGDAKQSIYRFRGADVTVFHQARASVKSSGGHEVGMDTCFRTHRRLVDFVNHLFPSVFTRESSYDTAYETMTAVREPACDSPAVELHIITQDRDSEARLSGSEMREAEASLIARRIEQIVDDGDVIVCDERTHDTRRAVYGDFALLFQASTHFEIYEQALADAGIPYVTVAGRGFYARQEINDLANLLAFLVSPNDSLRLAAALRSPLFALSDETLFRLRLKRRKLWASLCDEAQEFPESERAAVAFARETLKRLREIVGRVSAAEAISAALGETGYFATVMALPHGERRVANIEKFVEQARGLSSMTLSELVEHISDLKIKEAREGEATVEETGAVRLMTVHKSKGLEFPVVWITDATYSSERNRDFISVHPDLGVAINIRGEAIEAEDETLGAASFEMLKRVEQRMDSAEKKRLLYVAATRARDHLIISGALRRAKLAGDHWMGRIALGLGIDENEMPQTVDYGAGCVAVCLHDARAILDAAKTSRRDSIQDRASSPVAGDGDPFPLIRPLASA